MRTIVQFKEQISNRHELIEVTDIPNEYSDCLEGAGPEDLG
jgi:hypothetical protein